VVLLLDRRLGHGSPSLSPGYPEGQEATAGNAPGDHERLTDPVRLRPPGGARGRGGGCGVHVRCPLSALVGLGFDLMSPVPRALADSGICAPRSQSAGPVDEASRVDKAAAPAHAYGLKALGRPSACALSRRPAPPWIASAGSGRSAAIATPNLVSAWHRPMIQQPQRVKCGPIGLV
jgi:hypothetical protein